MLLLLVQHFYAISILFYRLSIDVNDIDISPPRNPEPFAVFPRQSPGQSVLPRDSGIFGVDYQDGILAHKFFLLFSLDK